MKTKDQKAKEAVQEFLILAVEITFTIATIKAAAIYIEGFVGKNKLPLLLGIGGYKPVPLEKSLTVVM